MKVNNVYIGVLAMVTPIKYTKDEKFGDTKSHYSKPLEKVLLYKKNDKLYNLQSNIEYETDPTYLDIGCMFIDKQYGLISFDDYLINYKSHEIANQQLKTSISKRKILKMYYGGK